MSFDEVYNGQIMFDLRRVCLAPNPCKELSQMIAIARANLVTLNKNPQNKVMGWTKELARQGSSTEYS